MTRTTTKKFKAGDRVEIDRSQSAYHRARGIECEFGTFVEYTHDKWGDVVLAVTMDNEDCAGVLSICQPSEVSRAVAQ